MKLLYITEDKYPAFRVDVVELFGREMPLRGHQIDWLMQRSEGCMNAGDMIDWLGNRVFLTPRSNKKGAVGKILNNVLGMVGDFRILSLALRGRYDVIQVRDKFFAGLIGLLAARLTGAKFVHWMSYPFPESKLYQIEQGLLPYPGLTAAKWRTVKWWLYRVILPRADHVFVQSHQMLEDVRREGIAQSKMTAVPMGITGEKVLSAEDATAPNSVAPVLMYLGVIDGLRELDILVRVLERVRRRYPQARLVYVGEGQNPGDRDKVQAEARRLGLVDAVAITGFLPMEQAWEHVRQADICFSPFNPIPVLLSTSPTKLIEYMAMAKCVVANEHPEQCQVLRDSGVGCCVPWDEQSFADEVCRLLDNPEAAREMAAKGPAYVRATRTYAVIADQVDTAYKRLLG